MNCAQTGDCPRVLPRDPGPESFSLSLVGEARRNRFFRRVLWTGNHLQLTVMEIPPRGEIGLELHPDTDQLLRVEEGRALVRMGARKDNPNICHTLGIGDAVLVPCGVWHNVINPGKRPLKLSSLYAPPQHPAGTVHPTKAAAEQAGHPVG